MFFFFQSNKIWGKILTKHHADIGRCFISKRREFNEKEDFHNHTLLKSIGFKN